MPPDASKPVVPPTTAVPPGTFGTTAEGLRPNQRPNPNQPAPLTPLTPGLTTSPTQTSGLTPGLTPGRAAVEPAPTVASAAAVPAAPAIPPEPVAETVAETVAGPVAEPGVASAPDRAAPPDSPPDSSKSRPESNQSLQVRFKTENGKLLLILPPETSGTDGFSTLAYSWSEVIQQLKQRLTAEARGWQAQTGIHLVSRDRILDANQLQDLAETLETVQLKLRRIYTSRRQTAIAAATAGYSVEQHVAVSSLALAPTESGPTMAEPLVLRTTLRSGADIRHGGTVVLIGDLNPGGAIVAEGDIVVWGRLRGTAHAGSKGNGQARIMALQMEPAQIRIAGFVARGPANPPAEFFPEVAYVTPQGRISIARVSELSKKGL